MSCTALSGSRDGREKCVDDGREKGGYRVRKRMWMSVCCLVMEMEVGSKDEE